MRTRRGTVGLRVQWRRTGSAGEKTDREGDKSLSHGEYQDSSPLSAPLSASPASALS
jgi:hypothetical protein